MSLPKLTNEEFEQLQTYIQNECGISVNEDKSHLIETRLGRLVVDSGCATFGEFYEKLKAGGGEELRDRIVDAMTTNETLWFRDAGPWTIINQKLLPEFCADLQKGSKRKIRIWSAACSTGQEPYTIAISILEHLRDQAPPGVKEECFEIVGTDISSSAIFASISGRYDRLSMSRGMEEDLRDRYFDSSGTTWTINDRVKAMVKLHRFNLMDSYERFGSFDLIMCRNVLIYFSNHLKREICKKMSASLGGGGVFVIGGAESLQGAFDEFQMRQCAGNFYYEVKCGRTP